MVRGEWEYQTGVCLSSDRGGRSVWIAMTLLLGGTPYFVTDAENRELTKPVSIEEIRRVLWAMTEDKAPGPNGFSLFFCRRYWPIIQVKVGEAVMQFFATRKMLKVWMRIFVTLVPKKLDAAETCHYKPISLYSVLYYIKFVPS